MANPGYETLKSIVAPDTYLILFNHHGVKRKMELNLLCLKTGKFMLPRAAFNL